MNRISWTAILVFAAVVLLVFLVGVSLMGGWNNGGWGMMGPGGMGPGMMGGWAFGPLGWIVMIFMLLIPIGFFVLIGLGIAWLVRALGAGSSPAPAMRSCPNCNRSVQADWRNCPHCGTDLNQ